MSKQNLLQKIKENRNTVIISKSLQQAQVAIDLHKVLSKKFKKIGVVMLHKSSSALLEELEKAKVNCSNYCFIDCESKRDAGGIKECLHVSSPAALTELALSIEKMKKNYQPNLLILDNISSLLIYNNEALVLKFLHSVMQKVRQTKSRAVYLILEEGKKSFISDLSLFADMIIES